MTASVGRKAEPIHLRLMKGDGKGRDSGGRKIKEGPRFRRLPPDKPDWLSDIASGHWDLLVSELQRLEVLKPIDAISLAMCCEVYATWRQALEIVRENGLLSTNSQGRVKHPALAIAEAASREYRSWAAEFGLTPAAESKLGAEGPSGSDDNPFAGSDRP